MAMGLREGESSLVSPMFQGGALDTVDEIGRRDGRRHGNANIQARGGQGIA
jgi:hypothetical protein